MKEEKQNVCKATETDTRLKVRIRYFTWYFAAESKYSCRSSSGAFLLPAPCVFRLLYCKNVPLLECRMTPVAFASFKQYKKASAKSSGCPTLPVGILLS
jgi:hypothetical protein